MSYRHHKYISYTYAYDIYTYTYRDSVSISFYRCKYLKFDHLVVTRHFGFCGFLSYPKTFYGYVSFPVIKLKLPEPKKLCQFLYLSFIWLWIFHSFIK